MVVPFVDLSKDKKLKNTIIQKIIPLISEGNYVLGKEVEIFEKKFAKFLKIKKVIGLGSGTDALALGMKALGVQPGDEILLPAMTFIATAEAIVNIGAIPVFVDINNNHPTINSKLIESKISNKTKAIIVVHLHGFMCDMDEIIKIAKKHKLFIIEDACQAHGSLYKGKLAGSFGDLAAFSFYPSKNLGAFGDAGAIATNDIKMAKKIFLLRNHGEHKKYLSEIIGYNSRLDNIQALILLTKLKHLNSLNYKRLKIAKLYRRLLIGLPIELPIENNYEIPNYHIFNVKSVVRDGLSSYLKSKNIYTGIHYPIPLHLQPALKYLGYHKGDFPNAEIFAKNNLSLPMFPDINKKQVEYIALHINNYFNKISS